MEEITASKIWLEFEKLMDNIKNNEDVFHKFMVKYPSLIPVWLPIDNIVYSKLPLGNQHVTDFAFARDDSPGFRWHFIEIERPHDRLFTKGGDPSARLNHALRQILDWKSWFDENRDYVAKYFPHAERVARFGLAEPHLTLVIGRRQEISMYNRHIMRRFGGGLHIRTFDSLKNNLRTAWLADKDLPLRCCSLSSSGPIELSQMKSEIIFRVG